MNTKNLTVYKSNAVIEAGYQLSLNEQRIVLAAIGLVDPRNELLVTDRFVLSAQDFCSIFEVSEKNAYTALIEVADRLFSRYVVINKPFPDKPKITKLKTRWISSICYMESEGKVALTFAPDLIPYLSQLKGSFTRYELKNIGNMTSTYGIRLYELLMQWKAVGTREIEIAWLKQIFQIEDKYTAIKDFKKYVIEPAVKDINTHSNFLVAWEQRKTGRAVTHLNFTFAEKAAEPNTAPTAKKPRKAKGKMINGVIQSEIEAKAKVGESYQAAAERIKADKLKTVETKLKAKAKPAPADSATEAETTPKKAVSSKKAAEEGIKSVRAALKTSKSPA